MRIYLTLSALALALLSCSTSSMIQPTPTATLPATASPHKTAVGADSRTVCADALNIRFSVGADSAVVGWLKRGDTVSVLESSGGWARLDRGWVSARYLC